jgi:hypothetical protein
MATGYVLERSRKRMRSGKNEISVVVSSIEGEE